MTDRESALREWLKERLDHGIYRGILDLDLVWDLLMDLNEARDRVRQVEIRYSDAMTRIAKQESLDRHLVNEIEGLIAERDELRLLVDSLSSSPPVPRPSGMTDQKTDMLSSITPDPDLTPRIHAAIDATKASDSTYWERCCAQRDPRSAEAAGSVLILRSGYAGSIEDVLRACEWSVYEHPDVLPIAKAFRTFDIQGWMGIVSLSDLDPDMEVSLRDPKETGKAEACVVRERGAQVPFVTAILGPTKDGGECMWTFHPGPPIMPSTVPTPPPEKAKITVREALALGLKWAKCVSA